MLRRFITGLLFLGGMVGTSAQEVSSLPKKPTPTPPVLDTTPVDPAELERSIAAGVDHLVKTQNKDGSWGNPTLTKQLNIYAPIPGGHHGFKMGASALALAGVVEARDNRPEVLECIEKGERWMLDALPKLRRAEETTTYNNWGHAYGLRALCSLARRPGVTDEKKAEYAKQAQEQAEMLRRYQDVDGGWGYLHFDLTTQRPSGGSTGFMTATVLLALNEANEVFGTTFPEARKEAALRSILIQRTPDFSYVYSMGHRLHPRNKINRPAGSLSRSQVCNAALRVNGEEKITDEVLELCLDRLVKRNGWLDIGRKMPRPHESHFAISGYFYFYGHYYATECVELLPEEDRAEWKDKLAKILIDKQESDGCWWDYPLYEYHYAYGTGYTLVALSRCRKGDVTP